MIIFEEIDQEEESEPIKNSRMIMVYLLQKPYAMQPRGYSEKLHNRIVGCFNENDAKLLWESVGDAISKFMN